MAHPLWKQFRFLQLLFSVPEKSDQGNDERYREPLPIAKQEVFRLIHTVNLNTNILFVDRCEPHLVTAVRKFESSANTQIEGLLA